MMAVVEIAGKQIVVSKGDRVKVPRLQLQEGSKHTFTAVLLVLNDGKTQVGTPHVEGAAVEATVVGHGKGPKVIVFKMKRRKKYRRRSGHRQEFTEIKVEEIVGAN